MYHSHGSAPRFYRVTCSRCAASHDIGRRFFDAYRTDADGIVHTTAAAPPTTAPGYRTLRGERLVCAVCQFVTARYVITEPGTGTVITLLVLVVPMAMLTSASYLFQGSLPVLLRLAIFLGENALLIGGLTWYVRHERRKQANLPVITLPDPPDCPRCHHSLLTLEEPQTMSCPTCKHLHCAHLTSSPIQHASG